MTLAELAEASEIPARTIRFYIARGLVPGPVKGGRGAEYTAGHRSRLEKIKNLQLQGRTLSEIAGTLRGTMERPAATATVWWQHAIADDVTVWVRGGTSPWRTKEIRAALEEFARRVQSEEKK
jgi:DNA-binding transcriptional MerR regulator